MCFICVLLGSFFGSQVGRRDDLLKQRYRQAARLARWREVEIRGIFDRETRRRFDDQHIQHLRKVAPSTHDVVTFNANNGSGIILAKIAKPS